MTKRDALVPELVPELESIILDYAPLCTCHCHDTPMYGCDYEEDDYGELTCINSNSNVCQSCEIRLCKGHQCTCGRIVCEYCVVQCSGTAFSDCNCEGCFVCFRMCYNCPTWNCIEHDHKWKNYRDCRS